MKVFKFGGASVKDASSVLNVAEIINLYRDDLVVVVSAMGKTTNLMEELVEAFYKGKKEELNQIYQNLYLLHYQIVEELGLAEDIDFITLFEHKFDELEQKINKGASDNYNYEYDQIVSFGEVFSTIIISGFLNSIKIENEWFDARRIIRTDNNYRQAKVDWKTTEERVLKKIGNYLKGSEQQSIAVTQGFIGHTDTMQTTTLGREGSDFTAGILAWCLNADEVIIWKDVPGMLNADPKYFNNCVKLDQISFKEAIELSYYGASVIHPKTIKPLQNKNIPLLVKSFLHPKEEGTIIQKSSHNDNKIASYIFKENQMLISFVPRDFSFIDEEHLTQLFGFFYKEKIQINLMQNSAISFTICIDQKEEKLEDILDKLSPEYKIKYNKSLELLTIRHFNDTIVKKLTEDKIILAQQNTRDTARFVMKSKKK